MNKQVYKLDFGVKLAKMLKFRLDLNKRACYWNHHKNNESSVTGKVKQLNLCREVVVGVTFIVGRHLKKISR